MHATLHATLQMLPVCSPRRCSSRFPVRPSTIFKLLWVARHLLAIAASTTPSSLAKASGNSNAASLHRQRRLRGLMIK